MVFAFLLVWSMVWRICRLSSFPLPLVRAQYRSMPLHCSFSSCVTIVNGCLLQNQILGSLVIQELFILTKKNQIINRINSGLMVNHHLFVFFDTWDKIAEQITSVKCAQTIATATSTMIRRHNWSLSILEMEDVLVCCLSVSLRKA